MELMGFNKIETKADVLKYAIEFTAEGRKPDYDEARKMFEFFTSLVSLPDSNISRTEEFAKKLTMDLFGPLKLKPEVKEKTEGPVFDEDAEF